VGVDLFFVLSGFLIGTILINNKGSKNYFSTFYIRRIVRIIPNYYLLILLFAIISSISFFSSDYFLAGNNVIPVWAYLLMVHNILIARLQNFGNTSLSITWSIGVEEQFYIIFPFFIYLLKVKWLPWLLGLTIIAAPFIRMQYNNWIPAYVLLHCRMDSIAFGALIAYVNHFYSLSAFVKKYILFVGIILIFDCLICVYLLQRFGDLGAFRNTLFAIIFSGMVVLALVYKNSVYGAFLRYSKLVWIGTISYSLYLFHDITLGICKVIFGSVGGNALESFKGSVVSVAALSISIGFSWLVYKKLETPFVVFGKRFKY
jgi:peptidoglycan/LPS O-acetylase OafA/YrhL